MRSYKNVLLHVDSKELTFHNSVAIPDIVPLVVDFNDDHVVGRAQLYRDDATGTVTGDLFLDGDSDFLSDPPIAVVGTAGSEKFESETGITYVLFGGVSVVSLASLTGAERLLEEDLVK